MSLDVSGKLGEAQLDVDALDIVANGTTQQTWHCKANREAVMLVHGQDRYVWNF